ncbi:MAG: peptide deformylase [Candidatus Paceibacterota bacterium]|jgi:peptide deformylase
MSIIVQDGHPALREKTKHIPLSEIGTPKLKKVITDMKKALAEQDDGVALAAPQIGLPIKLFIISGKVTELVTGKKSKDMVFINPEIIKLSKEKKTMEEGCLSVRPYYGKMRRSTKASIRAYNEKGERFEMGASGLMAQIFQHETDHLEGILFTDSAADILAVPLNDKEIEKLDDGDLIIQSNEK